MKINGVDKGPARPALSMVGRGGVGNPTRSKRIEGFTIGRIKDGGEHTHDYTEGTPRHPRCTCGQYRGGGPKPNRKPPGDNLALEQYNIPKNY